MMKTPKERISWFEAQNLLFYIPLPFEVKQFLMQKSRQSDDQFKYFVIDKELYYEFDADPVSVHSLLYNDEMGLHTTDLIERLKQYKN